MARRFQDSIGSNQEACDAARFLPRFTPKRKPLQPEVSAVVLLACPIFCAE